jgi:hypothetical protein
MTGMPVCWSAFIHDGCDWCAGRWFVVDSLIALMAVSRRDRVLDEDSVWKMVGSIWRCRMRAATNATPVYV